MNKISNLERFISSDARSNSASTALCEKTEVAEDLPRFQSIDEQSGLGIEYPVGALGQTASAVVSALVESTRAPVGLCAQSVLGAMSFVASMKADIE